MHRKRPPLVMIVGLGPVQAWLVERIFERLNVFYLRSRSRFLLGARFSGRVNRHVVALIRRRYPRAQISVLSP